MVKQSTQFDLIQWHEGMLLAPHHFQNQDERVQKLFSFHLSHLSPFFWGVKNLKIDESLLVNGRIRVTEIEGIMPDGLVFSHQVEDGIRELELDLEDWVTDNPDAFDQGSVMIYICLPRSKSQESLVQGGHPRYVSVDTHNVIDINTGESATSIPRLKPNIQLFAGNVLPAHMVGFPILRLGKEGDAYIQESFQTPPLAVDPASSVGTLVDQLLVHLRRKISFLADRLHHHTRSAASHEAEQAIKALSGGMMMLDGLHKTEHAPPFGLYQALLHLAGFAWGVDTSTPPPNFKRYNHDDIYGSYLEVLVFIRQMIDRIQEGYQVTSFNQRGRQFSLFLENKWVEEGRLVVGARASHTMKQSQLVDWLTQAVISSESMVDHAREKRIRGAERRLIDGVAEMKLYPPRGMILAEIAIDPQQIKSEENLVVFNVEDQDETRPVEVVLYTSKEDV